KPRPNGRVIARITTQRRARIDPRHEPVEVPDLAAVEQDLDLDLRAEDLVTVDRLVGAEQIELNFPESTQLLARHHAVEQQLLPERRNQLDVFRGGRHREFHSLPWLGPRGRPREARIRFAGRRARWSW